MYLSMNQKGRSQKVPNNWTEKDLCIICVSSCGRILGLGDLGANWIGIPIGKL